MRISRAIVGRTAAGGVGAALLAQRSARFAAELDAADFADVTVDTDGVRSGPSLIACRPD